MKEFFGFGGYSRPAEGFLSWQHLLFVGSLASLSGAMPEIIATAELIKIAIVVGTMILTGLVISLLFTTFAVGKFVNMKSNKIYLY